MLKKILITGARAPVALHFARLLSATGHRVVLADSQRFPIARATKFKCSYIQLPNPTDDFYNYASAVEDLVKRENITYVLPTCEEIFYLAAIRDYLSVDLPLWAPSFSKLAAVHNKYSFAVSTKGHVGQAPESTLLRSEQDVKNVSSEAGN